MEYINEISTYMLFLEKQKRGKCEEGTMEIFYVNVLVLFAV